MRCVMNQAVLYVTPSIRWSWCEEMPFFDEQRRYTAWNQTLSGIFDRSKTVPTVTVKWPLQA
jgi:hypothetical protein